MFQELEVHEFARVRPLFDGFDYSLSIYAAIAGNNPGRVFVDNVTDPRTALALTVEGYLLAGAHDNRGTVEALRRLFREQIFSGQVYVNGDWSMSLAVDPEAWEARLPALIPTHEMTKNERTHYLCHGVRLDWRRVLPAGYSVRRVDRALLHAGEDVFPGDVRDWMDIEEMWGTEGNFLSKGVSFVALYEGQVVAWCTPDCVAGDRIDVGIFTQPDHRRRGLAASTVAATVDHCLNHGFQAVGWHCNADNVASWKTAERVGFERNRAYAYYYYVYDPIDHLAELGWYYYRHGEYARTVRYYEQVFAQRDENPDYYYHLVASAWAHLGNRSRATEYLLAALEGGWKHLDWTRGQPEFTILDEAAWDKIQAHSSRPYDG
ncbi:MAG: GNAT family N-acetyltransferase [Anaerolineae bacterium]